jgi:hypothetical protein
LLLCWFFVFTFARGRRHLPFAVSSGIEGLGVHISDRFWLF